MQKHKVKTLEHTREVAKEVLAGFVNGEFSDKHVLLLQGDLGAGKTAFTKLLAEELGIEETVVSPTFALLKSYKVFNNKFKHLVHVDLYRLEKANEEQLINIGLQEYLDDADSLVLIEWPERLEKNIDNAIKLEFELLPDGSREINIVV